MAQGPKRWLKLLVPIGGLSIVPLVGIVYAATTTFGGAGAKPSASGLSVLEADAAPAARPRTRGGQPAPPRNASAKACCDKLHELAQTAEVDKRATFLAAGAACDAAETDAAAYRQVASVCGGDRTDIPPECKAP